MRPKHGKLSNTLMNHHTGKLPNSRVMRRCENTLASRNMIVSNWFLLTQNKLSINDPKLGHNHLNLSPLYVTIFDKSEKISSNILSTYIISVMFDCSSCCNEICKDESL